MLITFIADTQFHAPHSFAKVTSGGQNSRFLDQLSVFSAIPKETDILVHLGDLFEDKFRIETNVYDSVFEAFDKAPGKTKIIIAGNHDIYNYKNESVLRPFSKFAEVVLNFYRSIDIENVRFHCIPYSKDPVAVHRDIELAVSNIDRSTNVKGNSRIHILAAHIGVAEATVGIQSNLIKSKISVYDLQPSEFDYVFLGHIHKHQQLLKNAFYVGSPIQHDFGEREEEKGIMVLDSSVFEYKGVKGHRLALIGTDAPKFHVLEVSTEKELYKTPFNTKDFYKVKLNGTFSKTSLDTMASKYNIVYEKVLQESRQVRLNETSNVDSIINKYIELAKVEGLDNKQLTDIGKQILNG